MTLHLYPDRAIFGTEVRFAELQRFARAHLNAYPKTPHIEALGAELIAADFPEIKVLEFVREVCRWGGYAGISGRVLKRNAPSSIAMALKAAVHDINCDTPDLLSALAKVNALSGLGTPAFASKHLRFLCPATCPVFDSLLQEALPYSFDPSGFAAFAHDCQQIAKALSKQEISNPRERLGGRWFAADVEAALYAQVVGLE